MIVPFLLNKRKSGNARAGKTDETSTRVAPHVAVSDISSMNRL